MYEYVVHERVSISMRCGLRLSGRACLSGACRPFGRYLLILILIPTSDYQKKHVVVIMMEHVVIVINTVS